LELRADPERERRQASPRPAALNVHTFVSGMAADHHLVQKISDIAAALGG
jgi:hypothetical protein